MFNQTQLQQEINLRIRSANMQIDKVHEREQLLQQRFANATDAKSRNQISASTYSLPPQLQKLDDLIKTLRDSLEQVENGATAHQIKLPYQNSCITDVKFLNSPDQYGSYCYDYAGIRNDFMVKKLFYTIPDLCPQAEGSLYIKKVPDSYKPNDPVWYRRLLQYHTDEQGVALVKVSIFGKYYRQPNQTKKDRMPDTSLLCFCKIYKVDDIVPNIFIFNCDK